MKYDPSRDEREIGERCLIVGWMLSAFKIGGITPLDINDVAESARPGFTKSDEKIIFREELSVEDTRNMFWQAECLHVLLWSVGRQTELLPVDEMVSAAAIATELNAMRPSASAWLSSLERRSDADLNAANELLDIWLWRTRNPTIRRHGQKSMSPAARDAIEGAVSQGVLSAKDLRDGDVAAFGQPYYTLSPVQQMRVGSIVIERVRAIRWIWKDFDDWWDPMLDS